jgi:hypothetical protein
MPKIEIVYIRNMTSGFLYQLDIKLPKIEHVYICNMTSGFLCQQMLTLFKTLH